ncbi:MAG: hypothetical protein ACI4TE_00020 [Alphaproteobacteria bacterium]
MDTSLRFAPFETKEFDFSTPYPFPFVSESLKTEEGIKTRVQKHIKHALRENNQTAFVEKLIRAVSADNVCLMIVVPPVTAEYLSYVPPQVNLFENLEILMERYKGKVLYLNCYRDKDFTDKDFADCDHLNQQGAEKLTAKIKQKFQERE